MSDETQKIIFDVPSGEAVLDAVVVIRYLDEEGGECFRVAAHNEPGDIVVVGLLRSALALRESEIEGFGGE